MFARKGKKIVIISKNIVFISCSSSALDIKKFIKLVKKLVIKVSLILTAVTFLQVKLLLTP